MSNIARRGDNPQPAEFLQTRVSRRALLKRLGLVATAPVLAACGATLQSQEAAVAATQSALRNAELEAGNAALAATAAAKPQVSVDYDRIANTQATAISRELDRRAAATNSTSEAVASATPTATQAEATRTPEPTQTPVPAATSTPEATATTAANTPAAQPTVEQNHPANTQPTRAEVATTQKVEANFQTLNVGKYPEPETLNPNVDDHKDGKSVHNHIPSEAPLGQWYWLAFPSSHGEWEVDGQKAFVDDYGITWLQDGTNIRFENHGMPGEVIAQVVDNQEHAEIVMGFWTRKSYTDESGHTTGIFMKKMDIKDGSEHQDSPAQVSFKGAAPERPVYVYNAKGELIAKGATSYAGDITISLPDEGRVFVKMADVQDVTTGTLEVEITAGPDVYYHHQGENPQNRIDVSGYTPRG